MLYREIIAVCSEINKKHINILCGQKVELCNVKPVGTYNHHWILNGEVKDTNLGVDRLLPVARRVSISNKARQKFEIKKSTFFDPLNIAIRSYNFVTINIIILNDTTA